MNKELEFCEGVRNYLRVYNHEIENVLSQIIKHKFPKEVASIDFEIFAEGFSNKFPVRAFFMDKDNSEYFIYKKGKAEYPSPVDPDLLEIPYIYPEEFENKFTDGDEEFDPWSLASKELISWFSERWLAVGGASFHLAATIAPHDDINRYDLVNSKWTKI